VTNVDFVADDTVRGHFDALRAAIVKLEQRITELETAKAGEQNNAERKLA
jgi:hypothetical protein